MDEAGAYLISVGCPLVVGDGKVDGKAVYSFSTYIMKLLQKLFNSNPGWLVCETNVPLFPKGLSYTSLLIL